jgi:hypothetical protein
VALYNLAADVGEKDDRAAMEPERVAAMRAKLGEWLKDAVAEGHVGKDASGGRKRAADRN